MERFRKNVKKQRIFFIDYFGNFKLPTIIDKSFL